MKSFCLAGLLAAAPLPALALDVISCLLEPRRAYAIGAPVPGIIAEVPVERGDTVARGDVLLRIDARVEEAQLEAARFRAQSDAAIASRRVQVEDAQRLYAQAQDLTERGVATKNQLEELRAALFIAQAQLREAEEQQLSARLEVLSAEAAMAQRTIHAPADAVVVNRLADEGELAGTSAPLLELVAVDVLYAEVLAPSRDYGTVAVGQLWQITSENSDVQRQGVVSAIDPVIDAASRSFGFRIDVPNEDGALTAGNRCDLVP